MNKRFDKQYLRKRLTRQKEHSAWNFRGGFTFYWENFHYLALCLKPCLSLMGLFNRGMRNTIRFETTHHTIRLSQLPSAFSGFTILHLSDLHIDGMLDHGQALATQLKKSPPYDICVITGDFRFLTYGPIQETVIHTRELLKALDPTKPILGVLGNHDGIEMVPEFERLGIRMLINESFLIQRGSHCLGIAGIDDSHFYATDDLPKASQNIHHCDIKILLAHSQEPIEQASKLGFSLYLCGHTHGGQLCLPGGIPIIKNTPKPFKKFVKGAWQYNKMQGYTSRGLGSSCLAVRYNCPPEIVLHTLREKPSPSLKKTDYFE